MIKPPSQQDPQGEWVSDKEWWGDPGKMSMEAPMPTKIGFVLAAILFVIALGFIFMAYMIISGAGLI